MSIMTNHDMAKLYIQKCKVLGKDIFDLELKEGDNVILRNVKDKESNGKCVIPSFITALVCAFEGCAFEEVYVENKAGVDISCQYWFSRMESERVKIEFKHPECVTNISGMFAGCSAKKIEFVNFKTSRLNKMKGLFSYCNELEHIEFGQIDTSNVDDMGGMFFNCASLNELNLSGFNTTKLKDMDSMFCGCTNIKKLDLSGFDTGAVTSMRWVFRGCDRLEHLNLSGFNTENVSDMQGLFQDCVRINRIDLRNINTRNVRNMKEMFSGCSSLQSLDLSNFNTDNLLNMDSMFFSCRRLEWLDLSSFNTVMVKTSDLIISGCQKLKKVIIGAKFTNRKSVDMVWELKKCGNVGMYGHGLDDSNIEIKNI